jgi:hypothetical protein
VVVVVKLQKSQNLGIKWCLILGVFGFLAGYVGPIILVPEANQGPLLGIFITGPGGALAGLILWILSKQMGWSLSTQWKAVYISCAALLCSVVITALKPKPNWLGRIYELEIVNCQPISARLDSVLIDWQARTAAANWLPPRTGWEDEVRQIFREDTGSVVEVKIQDEKVVKSEKSAFKNETRISAFKITSAKSKNSFFYFAVPCANLVAGTKGRYFVSSASMHIMADKNRPWPPKIPSDLLVLAPLRPVPEHLREKINVYGN